MPKCSTIGCPKEATRHSIVDIGFGMVADVWSCEEHYKDTMDNVMKEAV